MDKPFPSILPFGALVISLDFELHWGVFDRGTEQYRQNLMGVWKAIPQILKLFKRYQIHATWATVGFLFAENSGDLERYRPRIRPNYQNRKLDSYSVPFGSCERDDPLHFAYSLLTLIKNTPDQEIGSHTFSHYFCLEPEKSREAFKADLLSATAIAAKEQIHIKSIVFPRNQYNVDYEDLILDAGFTSFRGTEDVWFHRPFLLTSLSAHIRFARLLDYYLSILGTRTTEWHQLKRPSGLCNIRSSRFLRPYSPSLRLLEPMRFSRIVHEMKEAAQQKKIFHLWWHPHNFGVNLQHNLDFLESILKTFVELRSEFGIKSLTMDEVATSVSQLPA